MTVSVRTANMNDAGWIVQLLQEGSQQGHFGPTVGMQAEQLFTTIIQSGRFQMMKLRGGIQAPRFVQATALVAEIDNTPASFLMTLSDEGEAELHLAGTLKNFRRKGGFRALTRHEITKHQTTTKLFARCYKKSTWAMDCLKKEGFKVTKPGDPIELTLSR